MGGQLTGGEMTPEGRWQERDGNSRGLAGGERAGEGLTGGGGQAGADR